jgi:site-specific DNA-cytosine methylase
MTLIPTLDLFSGIGGNAVALKSICKVVAYCDIDPYSRAVLKKHIEKGNLDDAPIYDDVNTLTGRSISPKPEMITAGFPCQDAACSNPHGKGIYGLRTGLFFQVMRLIDEIQSINYVLLENSSCITYKGRGVDRILKELRNRGFQIAMGIFGTWKELGAPHDRKRWVCLAIRKAYFPFPTLIKYSIWNRKTETIARLITHKNKQSRKDALIRCALLGNSVVPQQIALAVYELAKVFTSEGTAMEYECSKTSIRKHLFHIDHKGKCTVHNKQVPHKGGRDLRLQVGPYSYAKWSSPTYFQWTKHNAITQRTSRMLCVQLFHERETKRRFTIDEINTGFINPRFIEYLMGYPPTWTDV